MLTERARTLAGGESVPDAGFATPTADDLRIRRADVILVIIFTLAAFVMATLYATVDFKLFKEPLWLIFLFSCGISLPLLVRRRWPSWAAWIQMTVWGTSLVLGASEPIVSQIAVFLGLYSIGAWMPNRRSARLSRTLLCLALFGLIVSSTIVAVISGSTLTALQVAATVAVSILQNGAFLGGAWFFGDSAWNERELLGELRAANAEVQAQEQQLARQALDLERVRIARELHDGVAHHIAGVGIHAAAARRSLEKNPEKAKQSLEIIESSTRQTIDELRTLVYTLRDSDESTAGDEPNLDKAGAGPSETGPDGDPTSTGAEGHLGEGTGSHLGEDAGRISTPRTPGLADLGELIAQADATEQTTVLRTLGTVRELSPVAELTIYRIVQESLTNAQRYAGPRARVEVRLRYGDGSVEIEVSDSPARSGAAVPQTSRGTGMGLIGMRERVLALDGTISAGPKTRGGWLVHASLPYPQTCPDAPIDAPADIPADAALHPGADPRSLPGTAKAHT